MLSLGGVPNFGGHKQTSAIHCSKAAVTLDFSSSIQTHENASDRKRKLVWRYVAGRCVAKFKSGDLWPEEAQMDEAKYYIDELLPVQSLQQRLTNTRMLKV